MLFESHHAKERPARSGPQSYCPDTPRGISRLIFAFWRNRLRNQLVTAAAVTIVAGCGLADDPDARLELAVASVDRGELNAAIMELNNLLQANPSHLEGRIMLAQVSLAAGRFQTAEHNLVAAGKLGLDDDILALPMARVLMARGDFDAALDLLRKLAPPPGESSKFSLLRAEALLGLGNLEAAAVELNAVDSPALRVETLTLTARIAIADELYEAAETAVGMALDIDPFAVRPHQVLGALRFAQGRYAEAERSFIDAIEATRSDLWDCAPLLARVGLAESQWRLGKTTKAQVNVRDMRTDFPWHPLPKFLHAVMEFDAGRYDAVPDYLREVLASVPGHLPSLYMLASVHFIQGNLGRAHDRLGEYLAQDPGDAAVIKLLAATHLQMGNPEQALAVLVPIQQLAPGDPAVAELVATATLRAGDFRGGARLLQQIRETQPGSGISDARLAAALLLAGESAAARAVIDNWRPAADDRRVPVLLQLLANMNGDPEHARDYAKSLRREDPSNYHALLALAELAARRGDRPRAIQWLNLAVERQPDRVEARILLGHYHLADGDTGRALKVSTDAVRHHPYNARALSMLAAAQHAAGRDREALINIREAIRLTPASAEVLWRLAELQPEINDFWSQGAQLVTVAHLAPGQAAAAGRLAVNQWRAGNTELAMQVAGTLQTLLPGHSLGHEIEGDLLMLEGRFAAAADAYWTGNRTATHRMLSIKSFIAAREAGLADSTLSLTEWLDKNPSDQQIRLVLQQARRAEPES